MEEDFAMEEGLDRDLELGREVWGSDAEVVVWDL